MGALRATCALALLVAFASPAAAQPPAVEDAETAASPAEDAAGSPPAAEPAASPSAEEASERPVEARARRAFEDGVAAAEREDWAAAAARFRRSLELAPRPPAAFNLIIALHHLERPAELVRAAERFLADAAPLRYADQRDEVRRLRDAARPRVARLQLRDLPEGAEVRVDGAAVEVVDGLWLSPGVHVIELVAGPRRARLERTFVAGERVEEQVPWEVEAARAADPSRELPEADANGSSGAAARGPIEELPLAPLRVAQAGGPSPAPSRLAAGAGALAVSGFGSALVLSALSFRQANALAEDDPTQGGFLGDALRYRRTRAASVYLSLSSSVLAQLAVLLGRGWRSRGPWRHVLGGVGAALVLAGAIVGLRRPPRLGESALTGAHRTVGALLVATGLPLALAPLVHAIDDSDPRAAAAPGLTVEARF
ncbi:MAG TPA: hypothetical protein RMH85_11760 [Polyangiaceae bacterium LLY-WYZ-15_(1-7)]|nr:hypothetical protein [Polyangiaceae bacterium LLY-WYZ-15_(1-7)]HJL09172.1 hypothetical protein [Polyangiaceae bacterium LLY-WYZ-15_(1-7)]HJL35180.1 hypothetical protein [Polyangiaceae bacterium LLY-WYZ-15_(1-7)]